MYRQFLVRKQDRKFQRILWRNEAKKLQTYELNTVTFGITCAAYLAIRCLHQLN
ncbi:GSCOCG00012152001-RA-CDS [Cotesia congregata]|nr:GSCOCG00012152001-RA-CDS [Cotesia congregata]